MMDKGVWTMVILVGGTFVFIAVATAVYFTWYFATIHKALARINQQIVNRQYEDAYADVLGLWDRHPKVVDVGCVAVDVACVCKKYRESIEHAETCLSLLEDKQHISTGYFDLILRQPNMKWATAMRPMHTWLNYSIIRANFHRCYEEYDYSGALQCVDSYHTLGDISVACAHAWKAYFHMLQGHYHEAEGELSQARTIDPNDKQYLSIQGHWHLIHNEQEQAIAYYRRHNDWKSISEDFSHIRQVFGIKTPEEKALTPLPSGERGRG